MPIWAGLYKRIAADPQLRYLVTKPFPFVNDIACDMYKDDTFIQKIFQRKNRKNNEAGLDGKEEKRSKKNKKERKKKK
jgi:penicillin-binding protein 1A